MSTALTTLFQHNLWANTTLFAQCATLSAGQLAQTSAGNYGAILDTLAHIVRAERNYLHRIETRQPMQWPENAPKPDAARLLADIKASGAGLLALCDTVDPEDGVDVKWKDGRMVRIPFRLLLAQAVNHATDHRSQICATLTQMGIEPPGLDLWSFFEAGGLSLPA